MKDTIIKALLITIGCALFTFLVTYIGCNNHKYKYNFSNDDFKCQYDKSLLTISKLDEQTSDVFFHPADNYFLAYVDVAKLTDDFGENNEILRNIQLYDVATSGATINNETLRDFQTKYNSQEITVTEMTYDLVYPKDNLEYYVRAKTCEIDGEQYIIIQKYLKRAYGNAVIDALNIVYDSVKIN